MQLEVTFHIEVDILRSSFAEIILYSETKASELF